MNARVGTIARALATRSVRRRLVRVVPFLGTALAALLVVQRIRTKGVKRGGLDAALDLTPFVGRAKAIYELFAGDIIPARVAR